MDEEVLRDAAYRGTMRAFAMLCYLSALAYMLIASFLLLGDGGFRAFLGAVVVAAVVFAAGWVLHYISRLPRAVDDPPAGPASAHDPGDSVPPPGGPAPGIEGVTPPQPQILWDRP